jgi:hypothetical protein
LDARTARRGKKAVKRSWLQLLYLLYCAEAGIYLLLVPWSVLWTRMLAGWTGGVRDLLMSGSARGAVSALGGLVLATGLVDLVRFCRAMRAS